MIKAIVYTIYHNFTSPYFTIEFKKIRPEIGSGPESARWSVRISFIQPLLLTPETHAPREYLGYRGAPECSDTTE